MSRASEELRASYITLEGRLVEWVGLFLPEARFERDRAGLARKAAEANSLSDLAETLDVSMPEQGPSEKEWKALKKMVQRKRLLNI